MQVGAIIRSHKSRLFHGHFKSWATLGRMVRTRTGATVADALSPPVGDSWHPARIRAAKNANTPASRAMARASTIDNRQFHGHGILR